MAKEFDNTDRGVLFKNDDKDKDTHPDYKGSINVGGTDYWLSAWIKDGKKGKFMSLAIKPKDERQSRPATKPQSKPDNENDDGIPF